MTLDIQCSKQRCVSPHFISASITNIVFEFEKGVKSIKSALLSRARDIAPLVFETDAKYFDSQYQRANVLSFNALLKFDVTSARYPKLAPILFPVEYRKARSSDGDKKLFLSPEVALVSFYFSDLIYRLC